MRRSGSYSPRWRKAAAAAKGHSATATRVIAHKIAKGERKGTGPPAAASAAETPKISTGIVSGNTSNAMLANLLEYGKHGQPPKPFLKQTKSSSREPCIEAMQSVLKEELNLP